MGDKGLTHSQPATVPKAVTLSSDAFLSPEPQGAPKLGGQTWSQAGGTHPSRELVCNGWLLHPSGQEDYDRLRPLSYSDTNVVLICFDVTSPNTFDNILTKVMQPWGGCPSPACPPRGRWQDCPSPLCPPWEMAWSWGCRPAHIPVPQVTCVPPQWYPEVNHFCRGVPVLLVGCKTDLRRDREVLQKLREGHLEPISYQQASATPHQAGDVPEHRAVGEPGSPGV